MTNDSDYAKCNSPWSEEGFVNQATNIPHPSGAEPAIPDRTKRAILEILTSRSEEWKNKQRHKLSRIRQYAKDLAPREASAKRQISPAVYKVKRHKETILTAELVKRIHYGDLDVAHRLLTGFPRIGTMQEIPLFERREPPWDGAVCSGTLVLMWESGFGQIHLHPLASQHAKDWASSDT